MTTIPDDMVERVGRALAAAADDEFEPNRDFWGRYSRAAIEAMQPAILAERERCAKIAERYGAERAGASDGQTHILRDVNGLDIAYAIRSQS